jgi:FKBP-type peptidyl-prolyl cis-trans isomerase FkpA/FKBP-type peptidyl-prolyl cis-trans isomerase FklB
MEGWFVGVKHLQVYQLYIFKRSIYKHGNIFMRAHRLYFIIAILSTFPVSGVAQLGLIKGEVFLKQNAKKEGVRVLPSGLQIKVIKEGEGRQPKPTDKVVVHYRGRLIDGKEFDSSYKRGQPAEFALNGVIKGWTEGLQLLREGGKAELYVPSQLAYGSRGSGGLIGPDEALVFEVELISIK